MIKLDLSDPLDRQRFVRVTAQQIVEALSSSLGPGFQTIHTDLPLPGLMKRTGTLDIQRYDMLSTVISHIHDDIIRTEMRNFVMPDPPSGQQESCIAHKNGFLIRVSYEHLERPTLSFHYSGYK